MQNIVDLYGFLKLIKEYKMFPLELKNYAPPHLKGKKKKYGVVICKGQVIGVLSKWFWQMEKTQIRELFNREISSGKV